MKQIWILCALGIANVAQAQYAGSASGSSTLAAEINGKINHQEAAGAPSSRNCTQGKDLYTNTTNNDQYKCTVTGTPGTWVLVATGGSAVWGGITGTLSGQTDLAAALALKSPIASPVFTGQATIPDMTLAGHSHTNAAGGGALDAAAIASGIFAIGRIPTGTSGTTVALGNHAHTVISGITISGTPSVGQTPVATSTTAATWQTPAGGGGGFTGCTTDGANGITCTGGITALSFTSGSGSGVAGVAASTAGTAPALVANTWGWHAGTTAPAGGAHYVYPAAAASGFMRATNSAGEHTVSHSELSGDATTSGSNVVTVAKINGIAVTGTPSVGQTPVATSSSAATWQTPAGGSGGTAVFGGTLTSVESRTGTIAAAALTANAVSMEITLISGMPEKVDLTKVILQEITSFTCTVTTVTASAALSSGGSRLAGPLTLKGTAITNLAQDSPGVPVLTQRLDTTTGTYTIVVLFTGSSALATGGVSNCSTGLLGWQVAGYSRA